MNDRLLDELNQLMAYDETGIIVVLIDSPEKMEELYTQHPALASHFECINNEQPDEEDEQEIQDPRPVRMVRPKRDMEPLQREEEVYQEKEEEPEAEADEIEGSYAEEESEEILPDDEELYEDEDSYQEDQSYEDEEDDVYAEEDAEEPEYEDSDEPAEPEEEMTIDEFAHYATQYASQIDCSITGKSMLALYERIEIMEEENVPLTRANAEALIEEAADKAEKPSLGKMIKGVFSSKYDKDGLLILKEEHFI